MNEWILAFLWAVAEVEQTPGNPYGVTKACIADVNRSHQAEVYRLCDRRDPAKARQIILRYVSLYHPEHVRFNPLVAAAIVHAGPRGAETSHGREYARRVVNLMQDRVNGRAGKISTGEAK